MGDAVTCPACNGEASRVMYALIPAWLCDECDPPALFGAGSWLIAVLLFNGWFMRYDGPWWRAAVRWFAGPEGSA